MVAICVQTWWYEAEGSGEMLLFRLETCDKCWSSGNQCWAHWCVRRNCRCFLFPSYSLLFLDLTGDRLHIFLPCFLQRLYLLLPIPPQRDLAQIYSSLEMASQVDRIVKKASVRLAFTSQGIEYRSLHGMLQLYRILVRLQFVYWVHCWSSCSQKDVVKLQVVQWRYYLGLEGLN